MPGFKPAVRSAGKASGKQGHATAGKASGGCGTGAGGFKAGNTCGHKGNRNTKVEEARAAHSTAKAELLGHLKEHRKTSKATAKTGQKVEPSKKLHTAIKKAAVAHGTLKAARDTHKAEQRQRRNTSAKERRAIKSGKAQPLTAKPKAPAREGQARSPATDKGSRNDRLAVLAARHDRHAKSLTSAADKSYIDADIRHTTSGLGNHSPTSPQASHFYNGARSLRDRANTHARTADKLRESVHDPVKSDAAARTLKSLAGNPVGHYKNVDAIRATAGKLTHAELKSAADKAGVGHGGSRNRHELRDHLIGTVGKAKAAEVANVEPAKPSLREQAAAHRDTKGDIEARKQAVASKVASRISEARALADVARRQKPKNADAARDRIGRIGRYKRDADRASKARNKIGTAGDHMAKPPAASSMPVPTVVAKATKATAAHQIEATKRFEAAKADAAIHPKEPQNGFDRLEKRDVEARGGVYLQDRVEKANRAIEAGKQALSANHPSPRPADHAANDILHAYDKVSDGPNTRAHIADLRLATPHLSDREFDAGLLHAALSGKASAYKNDDTPGITSRDRKHAFVTPAGDPTHVVYARGRGT